MDEVLNLTLIDNSGNTIKESQIDKPHTYEDLLNSLKDTFPNCPKYFTIFYKTSSGKEIEIHTNEEYLLANNELYIRQIELNNLNESIFTRVYNKLPDEKKDILNDKYNCLICMTMVKEENPYFCYVCQKVFHSNCLEFWSKENKNRGQIMVCPNCRYKLTFKEWKKKLDYEKSRQNDIEIINQLNKDIISYNKFKEKSTNILKGVLNKITEMKRRIKSKENYKLISLANNLSSDITNPPLKDISNVIYDELEQFSEHIKKNYNVIQKKRKNVKDFKQIELNLKYKIWDKKSTFFGKKFVENNKDKIDIFIDGKEYPLESNINPNKKDFTMKIIFKEPITNFEYMFQNCNSPSNLEELKNIDTSSATNLQYMFYNFSNDISFVQNYDVSKVENFCCIFARNFNLDLTGLYNWDVSNGKDFSGMFSGNYNMKNYFALSNWDVSNGIDFSYMFNKCEMSDLSLFKFWNVGKGENFSFMFSNIKRLRDIDGVKDWNVSNGTSFSSMFANCSLTDISPLKNWDVSKGRNFKNMINGNSKLVEFRSFKKNITILKSMNFHDKNYIKLMFPEDKRNQIKL